MSRKTCRLVDLWCQASNYQRLIDSNAADLKRWQSQGTVSAGERLMIASENGEFAKDRDRYLNRAAKISLTEHEQNYVLTKHRNDVLDGIVKELVDGGAFVAPDWWTK
jgi:hypothetical protein